MESNEELVSHLSRKGVLNTENIIESFRAVDRKQFVSDTKKAYIDKPIPIGYEQTISQPYTVAFMLEQLQPRKEENILDVGSGSGYTTALLAHIVGTSGNVTGVERIQELAQLGWRNVEGLYAEQSEIHQAKQDVLGWPENAPYDRILVSASTDHLPQELVDQLRIGGVMVLPINDSLVRVTKRSQEKLDIKDFPGFRFVPLKQS